MIRIGNASGFYGDRAGAWREMLDGGELDVLTGDYLAELTMLILGRDRMKDPAAGFARTFLRQLEGVLGTALDRGTRIVTNAGGLNPASLADAIRALADRLGLAVRVAHVEGDDVTDRAGALGLGAALIANAYLGGFGIAECLRAGADVVVTGRVTDASLVVGPGIARFGWARDDLDALAGATVAGHVLECGAQATGGNFAFFTELPDGARRPGFPLAELHADGSAVITKHPGTGGAVTVETVTAQLLYEIGSPAYLGPDVVADFTTVRLAPDGPDRVRVSGTRGTPPPPTLKVGANALGGFRNAMTFVLCGLQIEEKAALVRAQLEDALGPDGLEFALARTDHPDAADEPSASALLTVHIKDQDARRAGRTFSQAAVELALASYPGLTLTSPPGDATPYGVFTAHLVPQEAVAHTAVLPDGSRQAIPPPEKTMISRISQDAPASGLIRDAEPTGRPTRAPLGRPSDAPASGLVRDAEPTGRPTRAPLGRPSDAPASGLVRDAEPTGRPTRAPLGRPSDAPASGLVRDAEPTGRPTRAPLGRPSDAPASGLVRDAEPTGRPTRAPLGRPFDAPASGLVRDAEPTGRPARAPLGALFGARSGDKGGDANIGVWARGDAAFEWLRAELTVDRLKELLPEAAGLDVERYELANLRAVNFLVRGILGAGVASSTRFDPQGKALGEWLRSRVVDLPGELLASAETHP